MDSLRLGIIGVGGMGSSHAGYLLGGKVNRCRLVAVCDTDASKLQPYPDLKAYTDSKELIRSGEVDAVLIATPHYDHTTIGCDALRQGLHVLVEKPISVHKADCERLINAWKQSKDRVFSAMFQMRTDPVYRKLKAFIDSDELGRIQRINWIVTAWYRTESYYASGGWRATWKGEGGGVLMNQCPHNLDMFQWLFGMPKEITARCGFGRFHDIEVEDDVTAFMQFEDGATAVFVASTGEAPGTDRLEVAGDRGRLVFENGRLSFTRNEVSARDFCRESPEAFGRPGVWNVDIPLPSGGGGHHVITKNFVDAILDNAPLIAPAAEGIKSVELANAMLYSAFKGVTASLPLDGEVYEKELMARIAASTFQKKTATGVVSDISKSFR